MAVLVAVSAVMLFFVLAGSQALQVVFLLDFVFEVGMDPQVVAFVDGMDRWAEVFADGMDQQVAVFVVELD